eukprot:7477446-Alexandrium_andersonii.AAC.1
MRAGGTRSSSKAVGSSRASLAKALSLGEGAVKDDTPQVVMSARVRREREGTINTVKRLADVEE